MPASPSSAARRSSSSAHNRTADDHTGSADRGSRSSTSTRTTATAIPRRRRSPRAPTIRWSWSGLTATTRAPGGRAWRGSILAERWASVHAADVASRRSSSCEARPLAAAGRDPRRVAAERRRGRPGRGPARCAVASNQAARAERAQGEGTALGVVGERVDQHHEVGRALGPALVHPEVPAAGAEGPVHGSEPVPGLVGAGLGELDAVARPAGEVGAGGGPRVGVGEQGPRRGHRRHDPDRARRPDGALPPHQARAARRPAPTAGRGARCPTSARPPRAEGAARRPAPTTSTPSAPAGSFDDQRPGDGHHGVDAAHAAATSRARASPTTDAPSR